MDIQDYYLLIALVICVLINCISTWKIDKSSSFNDQQKIYQLMIVWLIPLVGSILILLLLKSFNDAPRASSLFGGGSNDGSSGMHE